MISIRGTIYITKAAQVGTYLDASRTTLLVYLTVVLLAVMALLG